MGFSGERFAGSRFSPGAVRCKPLLDRFAIARPYRLRARSKICNDHLLPKCPRRLKYFSGLAHNLRCPERNSSVGHAGYICANQGDPVSASELNIDRPGMVHHVRFL